MLTVEEQEFIDQHYPANGSAYCVNALGLANIRQLYSYCFKANLRLTPETRKRVNSKPKPRAYKPFEDYRVNPTQFMNPQTPQVSYILGLLWADGNVRRKMGRVEIEALADDLEQIKPHFLFTGRWCFSYRFRQNRRPTLWLNTCNRPLADFLSEHDYLSKDKSADKILSIVPDELKRFWWRGFSDGDGCFYLGSGQSQFSFTSCFQQDWAFVQALFNQLQIPFSIKTCEHQCASGKVHRNSVIRLTNAQRLSKFGAYIYEGFERDRIGFQRKFDKFKKIWNG